MQFQVPQFIEEKAKIVGPLTFQQFIFFLIASFLSAIAYFSFPRFIFYLISIFSFALAASFAFLKIEGRPLLTVASNFFLFLIRPRLYLWKKKEVVFAFKEPKIEKPKLPEQKEELPLKVAEKSRLKKIRTQIELS